VGPESITAVIVNWADEVEIILPKLRDSCGTVVILHPPKVVHQINETLKATPTTFALIIDGATLEDAAVHELAGHLMFRDNAKTVVASPRLDDRVWWEPVNPSCYMVAIDRFLARAGQLDERVDSFGHSRLVSLAVRKHSGVLDTCDAADSYSLQSQRRMVALGNVYYDQIRDLDVVRNLEGA